MSDSNNSKQWKKVADECQPRPERKSSGAEPYYATLSRQALVKTSRKSVDMSQGGDGSAGLVEVTEDSEEQWASDDNSDYECPVVGNTTLPAQEDRPPVPDLYTSPPPIRDLLETETSESQDCTFQECLPFLAGLESCGRTLFDYNDHGVPRLDRNKHIRYLHDTFGKLPAGFVAYDASRPWLLYWALTGLSILGEDVEQYRERLCMKNS